MRVDDFRRESTGVINYGQRGRRGFPGRGVRTILMDSEGLLTLEFDDGSKGLEIGKIPAGPQGEPGLNGRVVDVLLSGQSLVNSEGIAEIPMVELTPGENVDITDGVISVESYVAGDNVTIEDHVVSAIVPEYKAGDNVMIDSELTISAIDTTYTAGENIFILDNEISAVVPEYKAGNKISISDDYTIDCLCEELIAGDNVTILDGIISAKDTTYEAGDNINIVGNVINAIQNEPLIGREIVSTVDVGGIKKGDVLPADMKLDELLNKLFNPEKPANYDIWYGMFETPELSVSKSSWSMEQVPSTTDKFNKIFPAVKQHIHIAVPAEMGRITAVNQGGLGLNINVFDEYNITVDGNPYYLYVTNKLQGTIDFRCTFGGR